jgi:hypothetical protein
MASYFDSAYAGSIREKRYAIASCHVERPLDDTVWHAFERLQEERPGGFAIAALLRPPDPNEDEDPERWIARALAAAGRGPIGHHTHFDGAGRARPSGPGAVDRFRREAEWLEQVDVAPTVFCGGGWYMDADLAGELAVRGYADSSATRFPLPWLKPGDPHMTLDRPAWLTIGDGLRLLELPLTRSLGSLWRGMVRPGGLDEPVLHVYFHDWELADARRRAAIATGLRLLARRRTPTDLDTLRTSLVDAPELPLTHVLASF